MLLSGKLNKIRTFALFLIFISFGIMYLGFIWPSLMTVFLVIGIIFTCMSVGIYFWVGILSSQSIRVVCPSCNKTTKILGKRDECMFCNAILSMDPKDKIED